MKKVTNYLNSHMVKPALLWTVAIAFYLGWNILAARYGLPMPVGHILLWVAGLAGIVYIGNRISSHLDKSRAAKRMFELSDERMKEAEQLVHLGHWEIDHLANIFFWSDEVCRIFGFEPDQNDLTYENFLSAIHPEDREMLAKSYESSMASKARIDVIHRILLPDNGVKFVQQRGRTEYDSAGKPVRTLATIQDITERCNEEQEKNELLACIRQSQKMESIGTLAAGIAHDFNNILGAILGYTEMAREALPAGSQPEKDLQKVVAGSHRAIGLVKQILTFSRQAEQKLSPLEPQHIIKEALKLLRASIPTTIEMTDDIDMASGAILADPTHLHQVLMNLCTNAGSAMREKGGKLHVSLNTVEISPTEARNMVGVNTGSHLQLEVIDSGHGMSKAVMDRVFDPFFTTKPRGDGTGLGLSVVHGIIRSMGGRITVESELGKGSKFTILFPLLKDDATGESAEDKIPLPGQERILVVDDEINLAEMMRRMLENLGYTVESRTNSVEAWQLFKAAPDHFDLVITDMTMPEMTGLNLSDRILEIRPDFPVILYTGFSDLIDEEQIKNHGIKALVMKPVIKVELAKTIRKVLENS